MDTSTKSVQILSKIGYIAGCAILYAFSISLIVSSVYSVVLDVIKNSFTVYNILDEVGLVVFAIAVIDVAKYLSIEEVIKSNYERHPREERMILTKFVIIIATALALEGLVLTIEVAKANVEKLIYPVMLFLTSTIFIVGIGVYQKLNSSTD